MQDYRIIEDGKAEGELSDDFTDVVNYDYLKDKALSADSLSFTSYIQAEIKFNNLPFESDVWVIQLSQNTSKNIYVLPDLAVPSINNIRTLMPETSVFYANAYELIRDFENNNKYHLIPVNSDEQTQDSTVTTLAKDEGWSFSATYGEPNYWKNTLEYTEGTSYPFLGWHTGLFLLEVMGGTIDFAANGVTKSETNQKDAGRYLITTKDPTTERTEKWGDNWINKVDELKNVVTVKGKLGDVTMVDIATLVYDQLGKKLKDIGLVDLKKATIESGTLDPKDTVYQDDKWGKEGKFYFHPELSGTPYAEDLSHDKDPGLKGGSLEITDGDTKLIVNFEITDGFSGKNSENAVRYDGSGLDKLRIEQRLSYFGYPDKTGKVLTVDGKGDDLLWAGQLFGSAAAGLPKKIGTFLPKGLGPTGAAFINADNAPRWTEVAGVLDERPFEVKDGEAQTERWGTNWAVDWLKAAAARSSDYREVLTALSIRKGGVNTHKGHQTGIDIDIDNPGTEEHGHLFFKEVKLNFGQSSTWVLAADSAGEKVWVKNAGTYLAKPKNEVLSGDDFINTKNITEENLNLWEKLLFDNSSEKYDSKIIKDLITDYMALSVNNGVKPKVAYFNDPRIYNHIDGVKFESGHSSHIHIQISPPKPNAAHAASLLPADVGNIGRNLMATSLPEETVLGMTAPSSLSAVQDLGLAPAAAIAGSIDSDNPDRYYSFSLSGLNPAFSGDEVGYYELPRVLTIGLTNTSANLDFEVGMDDNNDGILQADEIIFVSTGTSTTYEELTTPFALDEGAYLVHIHAASGNANSGFTMNVNLQALSGSPVDSVGNTPASAKALVLGSLSTQVSEYLSPEDRADYYRITVTEPSHLGLVFHGLQDGNTVSTLTIDANGDGIIQDEEIIDGIITEPGETTSLDQDLFQPGTYLLAMEQYSGATAYTMDALLAPLNLGTDTAGDTPETARDLGNLPAKLEVSESVGTPTDSMDVFKFAISKATDLRIMLNSTSSSGDVAFQYDVGGDGFIDEEDVLYQTDVTSEAAIKKLDIKGVKAGIYYLQVLGNSLMR